MARSRSERVAIGFMIVWLVFWTAGILVVILGMGSAALVGDTGAIAFMALWLAAAGFGLVSGARKLRQLLLVSKAAPRPARDHEWTGDLPDR